MPTPTPLSPAARLARTIEVRMLGLALVLGLILALSGCLQPAPAGPATAS